MKIRCSACGEWFKEQDLVYLDQLNGLKHKYCYSGHIDFIKDAGTYKEMLEKYVFFQEDIVQ